MYLNVRDRRLLFSRTCSEIWIFEYVNVFVRWSFGVSQLQDWDTAHQNSKPKPLPARESDEQAGRKGEFKAVSRKDIYIHCHEYNRVSAFAVLHPKSIVLTWRDNPDHHLQCSFLYSQTRFPERSRPTNTLEISEVIVDHKTRKGGIVGGSNISIPYRAVYLQSMYNHIFPFYLCSWYYILV